MANVVITSTTNSINVVFNDISATAGLLKATWNKAFIIDIKLDVSGDFILVQTVGGSVWKVSTDGANSSMPVDTVGGSVSLSNSLLYDKLISLIQ